MSVLTPSRSLDWHPGIRASNEKKIEGGIQNFKIEKRLLKRSGGETEKAKGWGEISESDRTARVSEGGGTGRSEPRRMDSGSRTGTARARDGRRGTATMERPVADADPVSTVDRCPGLCSEQNVENCPVLPKLKSTLSHFYIARQSDIVSLF